MIVSEVLIQSILEGTLFGCSNARGELVDVHSSQCEYLYDGQLMYSIETVSMLLRDVLERSPILKIISLWVLDIRIKLRANYFFSTLFAHNILPFSYFLVFSCCVIDFQMSTWMH